MKHTEAFEKLVDDARSRIGQTDIHDVKRRIDAGEKFRLVDTREDNEWERGHLPGAIHLSRGIIERDIEGVIPDRHAAIVLYCGGGYRSALAADSIQKMGYTNVTSMDGGWRAWNGAGYPIEQEGRS